ncbi:sensor histidine kinase [Fretibacter rubidus]|uniref:ATP-binding protein n=1 Tax=Fretibacter rubidus TaxID=570162 RepID=UPI00352B4A2A
MAEAPLAPPDLRTNQSLVTRLVRSAVLWALPSLLIAAMALTWFYRNSTYRIFDDPLVSAVTSLIASANINEGADGLSGMSLLREPTDPRYQRALSGRYWVIGTLADDGSITAVKASRSLLDEGLSLAPSDVLSLRANPGAPIATRSQGPDGEPLRVSARLVILPNMDGEALVFLAAADSRPATQAVRRFAGLAIFLMTLVTVGLIGAVFIQVRLGLKPLFELRDSVVAVREGRADRVSGHYPTEIEPLATELNVLIDHNKDVVERAQTHVSNLAHALKTPLAVLMNEASSAPQSKTISADIVSRQTDAMRNQVDHHLRRARAAARGQAIGVTTPVTETVESLARTMPRIYRSKDIDMVVDIMPDLAFRGEKRDLEEMAGNLLDNACKWCQSRVRVTAHGLAPDEGQFSICVEDDGPGLPEDDYGRALKRGVRLDEATPGTGFGLAIVDDLARAYKGTLGLGRSDMGGLKVTLTLPCRIEA